MMRIRTYVCDTPQDLMVAIGDVTGGGGEILYQTADEMPESGDAVTFTVKNGQRSAPTIYATFQDKFILVGRT